MAWTVRALVFFVPLAGGWLAVHISSPWFLRPTGWVGLALWAVQAMLVASGVATLLDRVAQRALPLATLLGMSLTFPDHAPSRFGLALKTGTVRRLQEQLDTVRRDGLGDDPQTAATTAIEMVTLLGRHERLTRGHSERVRAHAEVIAEELGISDPDRRLLAWGVLLHDIGKLTVPPEILNKDGRPTDEEWEILKRHPEEGARLLEPLRDWLGDWALAAGEHHERWDGKGYPHGLAGMDISLAGRITGVADAYDVITSRRSYKPAMSPDAARNELVRCAGTQFDETVVRALLRASLRRHRRVGWFSWLPEIPSIAHVGSTVAAAPATAAAVVVAAAASATGVPPTSMPDLAFATESAIVQDLETTTTTTTTITVDPSIATVASLPGTQSEPTGSTTTVAEITTITATGPGSAANTTTTTTATSASSSTTTSTSTTTTTTSSTSTTTTTTTTILDPPEDVVLYLANPGSGDTTSAPQLAFSPDAPSGQTLPNYDTDRDSGPGLLIKRDGAGLATSDHTKMQRWVETFAETTALSGKLKVKLDVGAKDLTVDEIIGVRVAVDLCAPTCLRLGTADWSKTSTSDFQQATIVLADIDTVATPGSRLILTVVAPDELTTTDIWVAYDTAAQNSELTIR